MPSLKEEENQSKNTSQTNVQYDEKTYETAYAQAYADIYNQYQRPAMESAAVPTTKQQQQQQQSSFSAPKPLPSMASSSPFSAVPGNQEQLSQMLMAWYYSGYHTGKYQAYQELREKSQAGFTTQINPPFPF